MSDSTALNGIIETVIDFGQLVVFFVCLFGTIKLFNKLSAWADKD